MTFRLLLLRWWDELTSLFRGGSYKPPPSTPAHAPLTIGQMKERLQKALDVVLREEGFSLDGELRWKRPHPSVGADVLEAMASTKFAPEFFGVTLYVGFLVPVVQSAVDSVCGPLIIDGMEQKRDFAKMLLVRAYDDPDRPKKRPLFPLKFTFWNTDFREGVVEEIKAAIRGYALPYFDRVKTRDDLKNMGEQGPDHHAALCVWLGDEQEALRFLEKELQKPRRYGPVMRARLGRLREAIEKSELQVYFNKNKEQ